MEYRVAYTMCDKGNMPSEITQSLKSISRFVPRQNIVIFYTPPRSDEVYNALNRYAQVRKVPEITQPFRFKSNRPPGNYGECVHSASVSSPTVVFLDCDTIIKKDIKKLFDGDYDVFARPGTANKFFDERIWTRMFRSQGKQEILPMFNKGFIIFKNNTLQKIGDKWKNLINSNLSNPHPSLYHKEQLALSIALSGYNVKKMTPQHHAFGWNGEGWTDTYVLHRFSGSKMGGILRNIKHTMVGR